MKEQPKCECARCGRKLRSVWKILEKGIGWNRAGVPINFSEGSLVGPSCKRKILQVGEAVSTEGKLVSTVSDQLVSSERV